MGRIVVTNDMAVNAIIERMSEDMMLRFAVMAESQVGTNVPWAYRPLTDAEKRSGVKAAAIHALEVALIETVTPVLGRLSRAAARAVVDAAGRSAGDMLGVLVKWRTQLPEPVAAEVATALPVVTEALETSYIGAARLVVEEAATQGVELRMIAEVPDWLPGVAGRVVGKPIARVFDAARDMYSAPSAVVAPPEPEAVAAVVENVSDKAPLDTARQANHAVVNEARLRVVESNERKPTYGYASEMMDKRTCPRCRAIDGTEWTTVAEARKHYGQGGGFVDCEGGTGRCRGTVVWVYDD